MVVKLFNNDDCRYFKYLNMNFYKVISGFYFIDLGSIKASDSYEVSWVSNNKKSRLIITNKSCVCIFVLPIHNINYEFVDSVKLMINCVFESITGINDIELKAKLLSIYYLINIKSMDVDHERRLVDEIIFFIKKEKELNDNVTVDFIADNFCMSVRTLQLTLKKFNFSYSKIK